MKLLVTADIHYALKQYDWLAAVAPEFDVVVIAGDLLDTSSHVDGRAQIVVVLKYLQRLGALTKLVTCSGNHDLDGRNAEGEKAANWFAKVSRLGIAGDGDSFFVGKTLFTICPWWDGPVTRDRLGEQLAQEAVKTRESWIWVYHAPPAGSPTSWDGRRSFGDKELTEWIGRFKPDLVLCGHVHTAPFCQDGSWIDRIGATWVFNAGYQIGPSPAYIILDTEARAVLWFSSARREMAWLDEPLTHPLPKLTELPAWLKVSDRILDPTQV